MSENSNIPNTMKLHETDFIWVLGYNAQIAPGARCTKPQSAGNSEFLGRPEARHLKGICFQEADRCLATRLVIVHSRDQMFHVLNCENPPYLLRSMV